MHYYGHMSQNKHKLMLYGDRWEDKQACWHNFVEWVMASRNLWDLPGSDILAEVQQELQKQGLQLSDRCIVGSGEAITAWMLTYG